MCVCVCVCVCVCDHVRGVQWPPPLRNVLTEWFSIISWHLKYKTVIFKQCLFNVLLLFCIVIYMYIVLNGKNIVLTTTPTPSDTSCVDRFKMSKHLVKTKLILCNDVCACVCAWRIQLPMFAISSKWEYSQTLIFTQTYNIFFFIFKIN